MTREKLKEIIFDLTEDPIQTELILGYFSDYQKHQDEERVTELSQLKEQSRCNEATDLLNEAIAIITKEL